MIFGSWGSEEFGLIGSTEWAQENAQLFDDRAVAYINVDIAVFANETFFARASPIMKQVLIDASKRVRLLLQYKQSISVTRHFRLYSG